MFNEKSWRKTPNIIYYLSWRSCNNIIQSLVHQALSTINHHTLTWRNMQIHALISCHLISCLHCAIPIEEDPWMNSNYLALTAQSSLATLMCVWCNQCITIVTIDNPSHPFTYLSTGSSMELTCTVVNFCFCSVFSELLVVN